MTRIISILSRECEVRGTDATGIAYLNRGNLSIYKRPVPANRLRFHLPPDCHTIMGHTRLTTQGSEKFNHNNHPFRGRAENVTFALAHNGILHNDKLLQLTEQLPPTSIKTDSYVAVQLIEKQKTLTFDSLKSMAEKVEGSFTFTVLDQNGNLYFVKGDSPMCIVHFPDRGFYLYASTEDIVKNTIKRLRLHRYHYEQVELDCGDILKIDSSGTISRERFRYDALPQWRKYRRSFLDYPCSPCYTPSFDDEYWQELGFIAGSFGYSPDDIEHFQRLGYPPDVVEEILYYGDTLLNEQDYLEWV